MWRVITAQPNPLTGNMAVRGGISASGRMTKPEQCALPLITVHLSPITTVREGLAETLNAESLKAENGKALVPLTKSKRRTLQSCCPFIHVAFTLRFRGKGSRTSFESA